MSSWLGTSILTLAEWFYKKMPLVSYLYVVSKQISAAISPGMSGQPSSESSKYKVKKTAHDEK
ncbi:hypothetical protein JHK87_016310 [Glycine soja]|nr:hypothetical protein JHK87_016310 [Glycine soja]